MITEASRLGDFFFFLVVLSGDHRLNSCQNYSLSNRFMIFKSSRFLLYLFGQEIKFLIIIGAIINRGTFVRRSLNSIEYRISDESVNVCGIGGLPDCLPHKPVRRGWCYSGRDISWSQSTPP